MPYQTTITLYRASELTGRARERVLERLREEFWESDMGVETITEEFGEILGEKGYPTDDIRWRLSYCQGDGVAFYGAIPDVEKVCMRAAPEAYKEFCLLLSLAGYADNIKYLSFTIEKSRSFHLYDHYNTMYVTYGFEFCDYEGDEQLNEQLEELIISMVEAIEEDIKKTSKELEKIGYEMIKEMESEEYLLEDADSNGYLFTEDGRYWGRE